MFNYFTRVAQKGSAKSGNYGHAGRPGKRGGSRVKNVSAPCVLNKALHSDANAQTIEDVVNDKIRSFEDDSDFIYTWEDHTSLSGYEIEQRKITNLSENSGVDPKTCNDMVNMWSATSNDEDMRALSTQVAASKEFDVPLSEFTKGKIDKVNHRAKQPNTNSKAGRFHPYGTEEERSAVIRSMYDDTQSELRKMGIGPDDTVSLFRGIKDRDGSKGLAGTYHGDKIQFTDNALSSWTLHPKVARWFASDAHSPARVIRTQVPARSILSLPYNGFGVLTEAEVVVIGAHGTAAIHSYNTR